MKIIETLKVNGVMLARMFIDVVNMKRLMPSCGACDAPCCKQKNGVPSRCRNLFNGNCMIHLQKPLACRLYPFVIDRHCTLTIHPEALWHGCKPHLHPEEELQPAWLAHQGTLGPILGEYPWGSLKIILEGHQGPSKPCILLPWAKMKNLYEAFQDQECIPGAGSEEAYEQQYVATTTRYGA